MRQLSSVLGRIISSAILIFTTAGVSFAGGQVNTDFSAFEAAEFEDSELITNPWWTLNEGFKTLYYAEEEDECIWNLVEDAGVLEEQFDFTPVNEDQTDVYKMDIRVVLDREWVDERDDCDEFDFDEVWTAVEDEGVSLDEITYDWYAQDTQGNIWYMGEDTWDGESSEGSFAAGCDGAEPGIVVLGGFPDKGSFYQQEYYEGEAEDWGKVLNYYYDDELVCMKTKEWTPLEPGNVEHKFYCSDGVTGQLALIEELKGKSVFVEPVEDYEGGYPPQPLLGGRPSPIPVCPLLGDPED